jgi:stage II sporulation protein GA (sporulation sigma-E factor processing peptidase)
MYLEIYIDVVFLLNFFMDYLLLRLVDRLFSCSGKRGRCLLAALLGALFSCFLILVPKVSEGAPAILLHTLCAMAMLRIGCGIKGNALLLRAVLTLYLAAFLFGGCWEAFWEKRNVSLTSCLVFSAGIYLALCAAHALHSLWRIQTQNVYRVTVTVDGKCGEMDGFYDTGNLLVDPFCGKPVSVMSAEVLDTLLCRETSEKLKYIMENPGELENTELSHLKPHFLPVRTVSQKDEMMLAITLDELCIHTPREVVRVSGPVFALLYESSALGNAYKVLLNSRLLQ